MKGGKLVAFLINFVLRLIN